MKSLRIEDVRNAVEEIVNKPTQIIDTYSKKIIYIETDILTVTLYQYKKNKFKIVGVFGPEEVKYPFRLFNDIISLLISWNIEIY